MKLPLLCLDDTQKDFVNLNNIVRVSIVELGPEQFGVRFQTVGSGDDFTLLCGCLLDAEDILDRVEAFLYIED
jgi:hypothetical protein